MCHVSLICYYLVVGGSINRHCHFTEEEIQTERVKGTAQIRIPAPGAPPRALLTTLPSSAPLQAAAKRSGGLGDPPAAAGIPSLFVLLDKPGKAWVACLREDAGKLLSGRLLILQSKANQTPDSLKMSAWKAELAAWVCSTLPPTRQHC